MSDNLTDLLDALATHPFRNRRPLIRLAAADGKCVDCDPATLQPPAPAPARRILYESDPDFPGRTKVLIEAATREQVQAEMNRIYAVCDDGEGFVNFIGPTRHGAGFVARGEVIAS